MGQRLDEKASLNEGSQAFTVCLLLMAGRLTPDLRLQGEGWMGGGVDR